MSEENLPKNRRTAIETKSEFYLTGKPCVNGHVAKRFTKNCQCAICPSNSKIFYNKNKENILIKRKMRIDLGLTKKLVYSDYCKYQKKYYDKNKARFSEKRRVYKFVLKQAKPWWLTKEHKQEILNIYKQAQIMGSEYEVDHIVPLRGETVCGLHVPWNLQIITRTQNKFKRNSLQIFSENFFVEFSDVSY